MANTLGKVLSIPDDVTKKIGKVVAGINQIEKAANSMASSVTAAYKELGGSGLSAFMQQVAKATKTMQSNKIIDSAPIKEANTQAEKLASSIGGFVKAISNVNTIPLQQFIDKQYIANRELERMARFYQQLRKEQGAEALSMMPGKSESSAMFNLQIQRLTKQSDVVKRMNDYYRQLEESVRAANKEQLKGMPGKSASDAMFNLQMKNLTQQSNAIKRLNEYYRELEVSERRAAEARLNTPKEALVFANNAKTYVQQVQAIKRLETAYKNLGNTEEDVAKKQKISEALKTLRKDVREADEAMGKLNHSMGGLVNWGDQIMRSLALVFSISQIKNFIVSVAQVRGEFEKTEVALSSMLKSQDKANILFGQIKELALQSPFSVQQLVNTTKQLSAYQIEYEKLYDTTKRLSDISAGLGVDVGRLVLAFGQVKAANFLRGTELRQFTETGIDMLGELAKYYSELEGRMISAGEVQGRITKRMVSFGAVEEVFKRLTDKGGLFYDMQAKQANTIAGQISNLQDSISLMKNEIGEANEGPIKLFIAMLKWLADNYEVLSIAIKLAIAGIFNYKIAAMQAANGTNIWMGALKGLGVALKNVWGPMTLVLGAFEILISAVQHFTKKSEIADRANRDFIDSLTEIHKVSEEYENINNAIKDANETEEEFVNRTYDAKKASLQEMLDTLRGYGIPGGTDIFMADVTPENIDQTMAEATETAEKAAARARAIRIELEEMKNAWELDTGLVSLIGDNIETDAKDAAKAYNVLAAAVEKNIDAVKELAKGNDEVVASALEKKDGEDLAQYYVRVGKVIANHRLGLKRVAETSKATSGDLSFAVEEISDSIADFGKASNSLFSEYDKVIERTYGSTKQFAERLQDQDPIAIQFYGQLDKELTNNSLQGWADSFGGFYVPMYLQVEYTPPVEDAKDGLRGWQKRVSEVLREFEERAPRIQLSGLSDEDIKKMASATEAVDILRKAYSSYKNTVRDYDAGVGSITKDAVEEAKVQLVLLEQIATRLGISMEKITNPKGREKPFEDLISMIKKARKEYEEFLKIVGKTEASDRTKRAFEELISGLANTVGLDGASFVASMSFDPSGIETALGKIAQRAAQVGNKEAEKAAKTAIAELQNETLTLDVKLAIEKAGQVLEDAFGRFQLGEEFKKLGLEQNIIGRVFGIDTFSISDLRGKLNEIRDEMEDANGQLGEDESKFIEKWTKKLNDEERKVWINTFKEYSKYLKDGVSETVKIRLEEAAALEAINRLRQSNLELTKAEIELMKQGVKRDTEKKLADQKWADFADTPLYIRLFESLESASTGALEAMKSKLDELKGSLGNLSPDVLKSIMDQYNQLEDQLIKRSPFKSLISALKEVNTLKSQGLTLDKLTLQLAQQQSTLEDLKEARSEVSEMIAKGIATPDSLFSLDEAIKLQNKNIQTTIGQMDAYGRVDVALQATAQRMQLIEQIGNTFLDSAMGAIEAFGGEADESTRAVADFLGSMLGLVAQIPAFIASIKAAGLALNSALGIIGMIGMAMSALVSMFSFVSQLHDARIEKQIKKELNLIEKLERAYDKLSEKIEEAYSKDTYEGASDLAASNLKKQNEALERAIAAEESKKSTDEDRIKEWRNQMEDNLEAIKDLAEQATEAYGGFGSGDNIKSAAQDFVNAWVDAFNETGDGLSGLQEQMDSFIDNAVKKQLLMRLSEQYITPLLESFDKMFDESSRGGRDMTEAELDAWRNLYEKNSKEFDEKAKAYMDALGITPTGMEPELSGLQRGIQGVTETTAQALEALLNSVRFYTSDTNSVIRQLYTAIMSADEGVNPMLAELRAQTRWLSAIHELIKSATKSTGVNGNAMKVVIV